MSELRIKAVLIEDYKILKHCELKDLDSKAGLFLIVGANATGKSTAIDAIRENLLGRSGGAEEPIRKGAKGSRILVETSGAKRLKSDFTIRRKKGGGTTAKVEVVEQLEDGSTTAPIGQPRELLAGLIAPIAFEPREFARKCQTAQGEREQVSLLLKAKGIDVAECDTEIAAYTEAAKLDRAALTKAEGVLAGLPEVPEDTPDEPVDVAALADEWSRIGAHNANVDTLRRQEKVMRDKRDDAKAEAERLKDKASDALAEAADFNARLGELEEGRKPTEDPNPVKEQISQAETINAAVRAKHARTKATTAVAEATIMLEARTTARDVWRDQKVERLAAADLGVEGLAITADGRMRYNDVPVSQASEGQCMVIGTDIAFNLSAIKDVFLREASLLDGEHRVQIGEIATRHRGHAWLEIADPDERDADVKLTIVDGGSIAVQADKGETGEPEPETAAPEAPEEPEAPEPTPEPAPAPADAEGVEGKDLFDDLSFLEE